MTAHQEFRTAGDSHNGMPAARPYVRDSVPADMHRPGPRPVWLALRSLEEMLKHYSLSPEQWQRLRDLAFPDQRS